jgi:hypothetical protein
MCLHCGCGQPSNRHGNTAAITIGDMHKAMATGTHKDSGKGLAGTAAEVGRMVRRHGRGANSR